MAAKDVRFYHRPAIAFCAASRFLNNAVKITLGPKGRNVVIEKSYGAPRISKDGVTVAKEIELSDKFENLGAQLVREVASKQHDAAGDGTTTATVLASSIAREGAKAVAAGLNPMDLKRGIDLAVEAIVADLKKNSKKSLCSNDEIAQIGKISANGDQFIGEEIAEAMEKVGNEGVITVEEAKTLLNEPEVVEGMQFDRGYLSPYFITNAGEDGCQTRRPLHSVHEKKLSSLQALLPILEAVVQSGKPLIIIAEDVGGEALATLVVNKSRRPQGCRRQSARLRRPPQGHAGRHRDPDCRSADLRRTRHQTGKCDPADARPCKAGAHRQGNRPRSSTAPVRRRTSKRALARSRRRSRRRPPITIVRSFRNGWPSLRAASR